MSYTNTKSNKAFMASPSHGLKGSGYENYLEGFFNINYEIVDSNSDRGSYI